MSWMKICLTAMVWGISWPRLVWGGSCAQLHNCYGHGKCQRDGICECYDGWGSSSDSSTMKAIDCSLRVCPSDTAWADLIHSDGTAHNLAECSNAGICNRRTGQCECFKGYSGKACQRKGCWNDCSGHGRCVSKQQAARMSSAYPVGQITSYGERRQSTNETVWDAQKEFVCVCDSSWAVGIEFGQRLESEWFGPDCSLRHCPSADNPVTRKDETICRNQTLTFTPEEGAICQVDCAGQGICDFQTGTCQCFPGFIGSDCGRRADYEEVQVVVDDGADDDYVPYVYVTDDDHPLTNTIIK